MSHLIKHATLWATTLVTQNLGRFVHEQTKTVNQI